MAPLSNSTLVRNRSAILLLTALAAGCTVYYIHTINRSATTPQQQPSQLRRRNAQRRRRPRPRGGRVLNAVELLNEYRRNNTTYGSFGAAGQGHDWTVPLSRTDLLPLDVLIEYCAGDENSARQFREEMERNLFEAFLREGLPPMTQLLDPGGTEAFVRLFVREEGFLNAESIASMIDLFTGVQFTDQDSDYEVTEDGRDTNIPPAQSRRLRGPHQHEQTADPNNPQITNENRALESLPIIDLEDTVMEDASESSWPDGEGNETRKEGQSLLSLLYHISEDQARRDGFLHRGVSCNSCNVSPIRGIRYRCANCVDYDLCEQCETMQVHTRTHVFYKIRIPAPAFGSTRQAQPVPYPGRPMGLPHSLPKQTTREFSQESGLNDSEVEGLWDQFKCLANTEWPEDPNGFSMAINREAFDKCFVPGTSASRLPPSSLVYDRIFAFYDTNLDGLIGFHEFTMGIATMRSKNATERIKRMFRGYDHDSDGYVCRKDFLRMFRAYYALNKEFMHDMVMGMEEDIQEGGLLRDTVAGTQPISSAYTSSIPYPERHMAGDGKAIDANGDLVIFDDGSVIADDSSDRGDQDEIIGDLSEMTTCGNIRRWNTSPSISMATSSSSGLGATIHSDDAGNSRDDSNRRQESSPRPSESPFVPEYWPPDYVIAEDVQQALGHSTALEDITNIADQHKILDAAYVRREMERYHPQTRQEARDAGIGDRRERRQFYLDEEDGTTTTQARQSLSPMEDSNSHIPNNRHRQSYSTSSQIQTANQDCSQSPTRTPAPLDRSVGREILYQITQEGLNELLDPIFKQREDFAIEAVRSRSDFIRFKRQLTKFGSRKMIKLCGLQLNMIQSRWRTTTDSRTLKFGAGEALRSLIDDQHTEGSSEYDLNFRMMKKLGMLKSERSRQQPSRETREGEDGVRRSTVKENRHSNSKESSEEPTEELGVPLDDAPVDTLLNDAEIGISISPQHTNEQGRADRPESQVPSQSNSTISPGPSTPPPPEYPAAVLELHESVSAFDEANTELEASIAKQSLDQLLKAAGYSTIEENRQKRSHGPSPEANSESTENVPDPTMPQNRPNSILSPEAIEKETSSSPNDGLAGRSQAEDDPADPTPMKLKYLLMLLIIRWQDNGARGGPGQISFSEFKQIMEGPKGQRLGFLGSWIDMQNL